MCMSHSFSPTFWPLKKIWISLQLSAQVHVDLRKKPAGNPGKLKGRASRSLLWDMIKWRFSCNGASRKIIHLNGTFHYKSSSYGGPALMWSHRMAQHHYQWPFHWPKVEETTIAKGYDVWGYSPRIWLYMVPRLHFRVLQFPLGWPCLVSKWLATANVRASCMSIVHWVSSLVDLSLLIQ